MGGVLTTESQPTESQPTESQPTESQPTESQPTIRPRASLSRVISDRAQPVNSVSWDPDGARIVSGSDYADTTVRVWDAVTGDLEKMLEGHEDDVNSVSWDGARIVSGSGDRTIKVWDGDPQSDKYGQCLVTLEGHTSYVMSVSCHGARIVSGSLDKTVRVWDADPESDRYGQCVLTLEGHTACVNSVSFSRDGARIVSGSGQYIGRQDNTVRVWNVSSDKAGFVTGALEKTLEGHRGDVDSVSFSPDGTRIVSGSLDCTVRVWDANPKSDKYGQCLHTLRGHRSGVESVSWDGKRIVSGSKDKTIKVWDANPKSDKYGQCLVTLKGHPGSVTSVSFSPYGARLVSGAYDGTVRVWNIILLEWRELTHDIQNLAKVQKAHPLALRIYAQYTLQARLDTLVKRATDDGLDLDTLVEGANADGLNLLGVQGLRNLINIMAGMNSRGGGGGGGGERNTRVMLRF